MLVLPSDKKFTIADVFVLIFKSAFVANGFETQITRLHAILVFINGFSCSLALSLWLSIKDERVSC